jgi:hypothetical protein
LTHQTPFHPTYITGRLARAICGLAKEEGSQMIAASHRALLLAAAAGCLAGMILVGFVFYPPHAGWGPDFKWGDPATWVAAFGTIGTVIVALNLSTRESRRREQESYARGRVIASFLFTEIGLLEMGVRDAIAAVTEATKRSHYSRARPFINQAIDIVNRMDVSKTAGNLDKLVYLPAAHAVALAAIPDMKIVVLKLMQNTLQGQSEELQAICKLILPQLQTMKMRIDEFLAEFTPQFAT